MTQIIIDEKTSQTPIGELLQREDDSVIEMRSEAGELLGTLLLSQMDQNEVPDRILRELEADADIINERLSRPASEGLTKDQFLERLHQLDKKS
ncbi:MAG: hypothetical protein KDA93_03970 [Planctomycetaceae bacterium]|nr:hypothetical protein [Planctomycetaceae bacterium]